MGEDKRLQMEKENNLLNELVPKVDSIKLEIEKTDKVVIYGRIVDVGEPKIFIDTLEPPKFKRFQSKKKVVKALNDRLIAILQGFYNKCHELGVHPIAQITPRGANIFYVLTPDKQKEITPLILPPNSNKSILVPQGIK